MIQSVEKVYDELSDNFMYRMVLTDNSIYFVPHDTDNRHYQEILEWLEIEGNTIIDNGGN